MSGPHVASHLGSGTTPFVTSYLPNAPSSSDNPTQLRDGLPVVIVNPEDVSIHTGIQTKQTTLATDVRQRIDRGMSGRRAVAITNTSSSTTLYIGDSSVTTSTGHAIPPQQQIAFDAKEIVHFYGIASATLVVTTIEVA